MLLEWDNVLGWTAVGIGSIIYGGTAGSILFVGTDADGNAVLAQDNAQLFWDDTNNRVGIGTNSPSIKLHVSTGAAATTAVQRWQTTAGDFDLFVGTGSPNGVITGSPGDLFNDITAAAGGLYQKVTGVGTNTGWQAYAFAGGAPGVAWVLGGNTLGAASTIGSNDAFDVGIETNGTTRLTFDTSGNLTQAGGQYLNTAGAVGTPAYSFSADPNTGLYNVGADNPGVAAGGALIMSWASSGATLATGQSIVPAGAVGAPSYAFSANLDTGLYRVGANNPGMAAGGVLITSWASTGETLATGQYLAPAGAVGAPSYSFSGDPDTGIYNTAADVVGITTGGVARWGVTSTGLFPGADNTYPIGADTLRVSAGYWGTAGLDIGTSGNSYTISYDTTAPGVLVLNEAGTDHDVRIEGDTVANLVFVDASTDRVGIGTSSPATRFHILLNDAATNTTTDMVTLTHTTSGAAAADFGAGILFQLEDDAGAAENAGRIAAIWDDPTSGSESGALVFSVRSAGAATLLEKMRITRMGVGINLEGDPTVSLEVAGGPDTDTVYDLIYANRTKIAAGGAGVGSAILFRAPNSTPDQVDSGRMVSRLTNATAGAETGEIYFETGSSGAAIARRMTIAGDGSVGIGADSPAARLNVSLSDAVTNAVTDIVYVDHATSGTAANNIGAGLVFRAEDDGGTVESVCRVAGVLTNATSGNEAGAFVVYTRTGGGALTERWRIAGSGNILQSAGVYGNTSGAAGSPSYTFTGDPTSGLYLVGVGSVGLAIAGGAHTTFAGAGITLAGGQFIAPAGFEGAPAYTFTGDTNTGIFNTAADVVGFTTGGTARWGVTSTGFFPGADNTYPIGGDTLRVSSFFLGSAGLDIGTSGNTYVISYDTAAPGTVVFNESGADRDVRMESDTNANMFLLDASTDRIGIGGVPAETLDVYGNIRGRGIQSSTAGTQIARDANGVIYDFSSSARFKKDVEPLTLGLRELLRLRPVSYRWKRAETTLPIDNRDFGFLAEDVQQVAPLAVGHDEGGAPYTVRYPQMVSWLVHAMQQLVDEIPGLRARLFKEVPA